MFNSRLHSLTGRPLSLVLNNDTGFSGQGFASVFPLGGKVTDTCTQHADKPYNCPSLVTDVFMRSRGPRQG